MEGRTRNANLGPGRAGSFFFSGTEKKRGAVAVPTEAH